MQLAKEAEEEFVAAARTTNDGRRFLDIMIIKQVLKLRDEKDLGPEEIERKLRLKKGVVGRLGHQGIVGDPNL